MSAAELRFEAIYYSVVAALGVAVLLVRFDWGAEGAVEAGLGVLAAVAAGVVALSLRGSNAARPGAKPRDRAQRTMPLLLLFALLTMVAGRVPAALAAACLVGWALAAVAGLLLSRRAA